MYRRVINLATVHYCLPELTLNSTYEVPLYYTIRQIDKQVSPVLSRKIKLRDLRVAL